VTFLSINASTPDAIHFRSLSLENVRAFASKQFLTFVDEDGTISRWNLILGENGVGKTTLLQAIAVMRPIPGLDDKATDGSAADAGTPTMSQAKLSDFENAGITRFIRRAGTGSAKMFADLDSGHGRQFQIGVEITGSAKELESVEFRKAQHPLQSDGPLVIGYGAGRHVGHTSTSDLETTDATRSLFSDTIELFEAEEIMEKLAFAANLDPNGMLGVDSQRFTKLKKAIAALLPGLDVEDIEVRGPRLAGRDPDISGVHVRTPSGFTPFDDLSLGYQAMFAWTVDLAWRLFTAFPNSDTPLEESAVVLIDEVDLHLHPRWQRELRRNLLAHFPRVQFIATTHSPVTAQETLSEGGNVAVVRWMKDEAQILNRPIPIREWRFDQLLASELFGFDSDRSQKAEAMLDERVTLLRKLVRTREDEVRLRELDEFVASLPTASSPSAQSFEDLMRDFVKDFPESIAR